MNKDLLGNRCKAYENVNRTFLPERMPVILRLDACHFHSYTKGCKRPFDQNIIDCMDQTSKYLCEHIQGAELAYTQSDEISILLVNYKSIKSQSWYNNNTHKMCSVAAGMASAYFTSISDKIFGKTKLATFDCRVFVAPREDVNNVFVWRQQDCTRNSVQMLARSLYSHKQCTNLNNSQLQELCFQKGTNWNDLPIPQKRGRCTIKSKIFKSGINPKTGEALIAERSEWIIDNEIPIFSKDKNYIEKYVFIQN